MAILTIRYAPDPILRTPTRLIHTVTPDIRKLAHDMIDTMHAAGGVGLSANQVGHPWRLFVANPDHRHDRELVLINPRIVGQHGRVRFEEGCLSLPGVAAVVPRFKKVRVEGMSLDETVSILDGDELLARIFQHEIDHLNGLLFANRLPLFSRYRLLRQYRQQQQELRQVPL